MQKRKIYRGKCYSSGNNITYENKHIFIGNDNLRLQKEDLSAKGLGIINEDIFEEEKNKNYEKFFIYELKIESIDFDIKNKITIVNLDLEQFSNYDNNVLNYFLASSFELKIEKDFSNCKNIDELLIFIKINLNETKKFIKTEFFYYLEEYVVNYDEVDDN